VKTQTLGIPAELGNTSGRLSAVSGFAGGSPLRSRKTFDPRRDDRNASYDPEPSIAP
jgi:hypothetical protein